MKVDHMIIKGELGNTQLFDLCQYPFVIKNQKDIIKNFCEQISENIGKELIDILTPNFTTSNENSIIAGKVSIMSVFKNFFDWINLDIIYIFFYS